MFWPALPSTIQKKMKKEIQCWLCGSQSWKNGRQQQVNNNSVIIFDILAPSFAFLNFFYNYLLLTKHLSFCES